ncbi:dihydropteroate synthase, partial [Aeromonas dhakensis]
LEPGALAAAAAADVPVCLMHMQGQPRTMQAEPHYDDLLGEVRAFFDERIAAC